MRACNRRVGSRCTRPPFSGRRGVSAVSCRRGCGGHGNDWVSREVQVVRESIGLGLPG